jgi:hypothetical protein
VNKAERDEFAEKMRRVAEDLGEHAESVRIFCTIKRDDNGSGTQLIARGCGNWYAQYGSVKEWVLRAEEEVRLEERPEDDGPSADVV